MGPEGNPEEDLAEESASTGPVLSVVPEHVVLKAAEPPVIDGVLDDALWAQTRPITDMRQVVPVPEGPPSEATEVHLAYDADTLYIALRCFDSDPSGIRATQAQRDADLDPDDRVELLFDPFLDRRNAFWFQIGPGGSIGDALLTRNGAEFNKQWDGIWYGLSRVTAEGWEAEIAIPMRTVNFDPDSSTWGFNVRRFVRRKNEEIRWSRPQPRLRFFEATHAGTLLGLEGLRKGLGLDFRPFAVANRTYDDPDGAEGGDVDVSVDAGLDLFYSITPSLKLSLSFNTDFAETEVDSRQVNLTRFPLFFPEQRDFFLEDSGAFFFGPSRQRDAIPFFSRRIGLSDGGEVPLTAAAKLTGRADGWSFGALSVQTDDFETEDDGDVREVDGQNLSAVRVSRDVLEQSDVGLILTHGDPSGVDTRSTWGLDANLRTSRFLGDRNLRLSTYLQGTTSDAGGGADEGSAWFATLVYPNDVHEAFVDVLGVDADFDPALGFVPRRGIRRYRASYSYQPRPIGTAIRQVGFEVRPELFTDEDGRTQSAELLMRLLELQFESGDELRFDVVNMREVLDEPFEIRDGQEIEEGGYTFLRYGAVARTSEHRPLDLRLSAFAGEFWDGDRFDVGVDAAYRPGSWGTFTLNYDRNDIDLPSGEFVVHVVRARGDFQFGPFLSWSNFVQWDNQSEGLGLNSRLWWIIEPGNELFFVVNQAWEFDPGRRFTPEDSDIALKVGYTFRL